jgi:hypothetical protein
MNFNNKYNINFIILIILFLFITALLLHKSIIEQFIQIDFTAKMDPDKKFNIGLNI